MFKDFRSFLKLRKSCVVYRYACSLLHSLFSPQKFFMTSLTELKRIASQVRRDIIRMTNGAASGHPGGSLGCTEYMVALYFDAMKHNPDFKMDGIGESLFFLSNGHICPVWYSVLA